MISTHRITTLLALVLGVRADGQALPRLSLTKDLQIGAQTLGAQRDVLVAFAPDGRIVVAPKFGGLAIVAFDSLGNRLPWKVPVGGRDDADILFPSRIGFIAGTATMWVTDNGFQQIALIDGNGKIVKSLEPPVVGASDVGGAAQVSGVREQPGIRDLQGRDDAAAPGTRTRAARHARL